MDLLLDLITIIGQSLENPLTVPTEWTSAASKQQVRRAINHKEHEFIGLSRTIAIKTNEEQETRNLFSAVCGFGEINCCQTIRMTIE